MNDAFDISFDETGECAAGVESSGSLMLGDAVEHLLIPVGYWGKDQYVEQWRESVRAVVDRSGPAYLVTAIHNPTVDEVVELWLMRREDDVVVFENVLIPPISRPADDNFATIAEEPADYGPDETPSRWSVSVNALRDYLERSSA